MSYEGDKIVDYVRYLERQIEALTHQLIVKSDVVPADILDARRYRFLRNTDAGDYAVVNGELKRGEALDRILDGLMA